MTNQLDCKAVCELLPWWWNGTLEPGESEAVEAHLESCARCPEESQRLSEEASLFAAHIATPILVAHAMGESTSVPQREIEAHLTECADCRNELEMVRAGRPEAQAGAELRGSPRVATRWRTLALAAALVAAVGLAGWLATWWQGRTLQARLDAPAINVTVAELLPQEMLLRGGRDQPQRLAIPPQTERVALALAVAATEDVERYQIELLDEADRRLWLLPEVRPQEPGRITIAIATADLAPGVRLLRVYTAHDEVPVATYRFELTIDD